MFIRWQSRRSKGGSYRSKTTRVRAVLTVSVTVDGKQRQKYVAVIGSFTAERLDVEARRDFWITAHQRLSIHASDDECSKIEASLARRVPPPTAAEEAAWQRQAEERLLRRDDAMPPAIMT